MGNTSVSVSAGAQNTFSDVLRVGRNRKINASISGTFSATAVVQRRQLGSSDAWVDILSVTAAAEKLIESVGNWEYRIGVKTGGYTSGTVVGSLVI